MVVMDGIIMGPRHCAYENCDNNLEDEKTGVFCIYHQAIRGHLYHIKLCNNPKEQNSKTCINHQSQWCNHIVMPHDDAPAPHEERNHYFTAPRFYCVETLCAPCGAVIAWTKFTKSEGPGNIMRFLDHVYPTLESRPSYVCIDKACVVLKNAVLNGAWRIWSLTTRFIVDSYHYINHRTTDYTCRKWCNPAPLNGSAPNLVVVENDIHGRPHYKRAFNTQACEQLNAWLGGYQNMLNRMTVINFNWTIHALLFIHTQKVIKKQLERNNSTQDDEDLMEDGSDNSDLEEEEVEEEAEEEAEDIYDREEAADEYDREEDEGIADYGLDIDV
ncbi:hypothetical protein BDQ17DRAFT_1392809 [Cyathus striatus]|nr:hypothetical protein BDQ17DRAFT_1392809 [Cyathus striatus]